MTIREELIAAGVLVPDGDGLAVYKPPADAAVLRLDDRARAAYQKRHRDDNLVEDEQPRNRHRRKTR